MSKCQDDSKMRWLQPALIILALGFVTAVFYLQNPAQSGIFPPCPLFAWTGLYCPGCGSLRATHQLLHGNLVGAFKLNPLAVLSIPFLIYGYVAHVTLIRTGKTLPGSFLKSSIIWIIFAFIICYGVLRNVPVYPFTLLAPH